jgi:hypothetical protein
MNVGMLWFDNDPKLVLKAKVSRAARYYEQKYGKTPTICFVHPSMLPPAVASKENGRSGNGKPQVEGGGAQEVIKAGEVEIRSNRAILPDHFWIGVNGKLNGNGRGGGS